MTVYFIRNTDTGRVKVGYTRRPATARLKDMQSGCDGELKVMGHVPGTRRDEALAHSILRPHNFRGEWFQWNRDVERTIRLWLSAGCVEGSGANTVRVGVLRDSVPSIPCIRYRGGWEYWGTQNPKCDTPQRLAFQKLSMKAHLDAWEANYADNEGHCPGWLFPRRGCQQHYYGNDCLCGPFAFVTDHVRWLNSHRYGRIWVSMPNWNPHPTHDEHVAKAQEAAKRQQLFLRVTPAASWYGTQMALLTCSLEPLPRVDVHALRVRAESGVTAREWSVYQSNPYRREDA